MLIVRYKDIPSLKNYYIFENELLLDKGNRNILDYLPKEMYLKHVFNSFCLNLLTFINQ